MASKKLPVTPQSKPNKINKLGTELAVLPHTQQRDLFVVERQAEFEGIEMGVLSSGMPYLSERGLSGMCGIDNSVLNELATNWHQERTKPRGRQIEVLLRKSGYDEDSLYLRSTHNGRDVNAYPEPVCIALLEYYAFITKDPKEMAQYNFRNLARVKFREYVYQAVGYSPEQRLLDSWKHFHDRVDLTESSVPDGYFCIFREAASMIIPMIRAGISISDKVIPDISVGIQWSNHWKSNLLETKFGPRITYDHNYPDYYPQCKSNPQPAKAYPDTALAEFKRWLKHTYIKEKLHPYMMGQIGKGTVSATTATMAILALTTGKRSNPPPALA